MADLVGTREQLLFGKWSYDEVEVSYGCTSACPSAPDLVVVVPPPVPTAEQSTACFALAQAGLNGQHAPAG